MATRSTISLVLRKEDIGKEMKFDVTKLPKGVVYADEYIDMVQSVVLEQPVLEVYCHWGGSTENLGLTLFKQYNDYDTILNLLLGGDTSYIYEDNVCQYCAWRGEKWEDVKPIQTDSAEYKEDFAYQFNDGEWYVYYGDLEWEKLREHLEYEGLIEFDEDNEVE